MTYFRINRANLLDLIDPVRRQIQHFSPQLTPGESEYFKMFGIVFTGLCGERGFQLWAEERGLRPKAGKEWKEDFIVGRENALTEIKTFKRYTLESYHPHIPYWKLRMIEKHSQYVVFCEVSLNKVVPNMERMEQWYTDGTNFRVLGWLPIKDILEKINPETPSSTEIRFPIAEMRNIEEYVEMIKTSGTNKVDVDKELEQKRRNNEYKFRRLNNGKKRHKKVSMRYIK